MNGVLTVALFKLPNMLREILLSALAEEDDFTVFEPASDAGLAAPIEADVAVFTPSTDNRVRESRQMLARINGSSVVAIDQNAADVFLFRMQSQHFEQPSLSSLVGLLRKAVFNGRGAIVNG